MSRLAPEALLWDVDGTLAETELDGHRLAFNRAMAEAGLPWQWDPSLYLELLRVTGGRERMAVFLEQAEGQRPSEDRLDALQRSKQRHYGELVAAGEIRLRPGVLRLMGAAAAAGVRQAIVTTSGRSAVEALLSRQLPQHQDWLEFWVCGEDVTAKKPDPQGYGRALERLACGADRVLAVEDSGHGVTAACGAGLTVLATRSASSSQEPDVHFAGAAALVDGLGDPALPCQVLRGPACPEGQITLSYLQQLFPGG